MGWPRKAEVGRIYRDKDRKTYFVVFVDETERTTGFWDAIANALSGSGISLCTCSVHPSYIYDNWLKRVSWNDLPRKWRGAFRYWLVNDPKTIRGFWRVGEQSKK